MKRFLLDTGIASDFINRRNGIRERVQAETAKGKRIGVGVPVLAELYFGIELSATRERNLQQMHVAISTLTFWPFTEEAAATYGRIAAELRRAGRPMQIFDMLIAAVAIDVGNCTVVSRDSDFLAIPGLMVENWAK